MKPVVLFGLILAATATQSDSPTQSNAFWASRPFYPTAMLSAKLLYCAVAVIGIPLVAQMIGLAVYHVPPGQSVEILFQSSAIYGLLLLGALVVASLTPDLRGFIAGMLAIAVGLIVSALLPSLFGDSLFSIPLTPRLAPVAAVAIGLGLLIWLYRRRDVSRVAWIGAVVTVGFVFAAVVMFGDKP